MSTGTRILALNVNHRTKHKPFPTGLTLNLLELEPDILVLTEFVEAHLHTELRTQLHAAGLISMKTSRRTEYSPGRYTNQVLIASRWPIVIVDISYPAPDPHADSNILVAKTNGFTIAGLRAPWYPKNTANHWRTYWKWICQNINADVATGDFNFDPDKKGSKH